MFDVIFLSKSVTDYSSIEDFKGLSLLFLNKNSV